MWLPFSSCDWLCAARELRDLEKRRAGSVSPSERNTVPLFCHENGAAWTRSYTFDLLRLFVKHIGVPEDRVNDYTPHSFRIYLCNALASQHLSNSEICAALRWASEDSIHTYFMTSAATFARWLKAAMGARFNVVRGCTMRRPDGEPLPRTDNDDMAFSFVQEAMKMLDVAHEHASS